MERLCVGQGGCGERVDELAGFEKGAGLAVDEEQGGGVGGRGGVVGEMEDLWAVVWNIYFHFILFEIVVDLCLWAREAGQL